jgi:hypothetical protein
MPARGSERSRGRPFLSRARLEMQGGTIHLAPQGTRCGCPIFSTFNIKEMNENA